MKSPVAPRIADYDLLRMIGKGSYGEVWLARTLMGVYCAVKVVYQPRFSEEHPSQREFEGLQQFHLNKGPHPGLVEIHHVGRGAGFFYYVMELADDEREPETEATQARASQGTAAESAAQRRHFNPATYRPKTLRSLQRPPTARSGGQMAELCHLPVAQCVEIGVALASALDHLHRQGLVHRDIKPSNIIFVKGLPKLADIGLVTLVGEKSRIGTEASHSSRGAWRGPSRHIFFREGALRADDRAESERELGERFSLRERVLESTQLVGKGAASDGVE